MSCDIVVFLAHAITRPHPFPPVTVETFVGGSACGHRDALGTLATFNAPRGIAVDADGFVYVADTGNHSIRIVHSNGTSSVEL